MVCLSVVPCKGRIFSENTDAVLFRHLMSFYRICSSLFYTRVTTEMSFLPCDTASKDAMPPSAFDFKQTASAIALAFTFSSFCSNMVNIILCYENSWAHSSPVKEEC